MKKPTKLNETIHIDDFMSFKRSTEGRLKSLEASNEAQESTMQKLEEGVSTLTKAIIGNAQDPDKPGMAEQLRSVSGEVNTLVKMHRAEQELALKETKEIQKQLPAKASRFDNLPWKAVVMALGIIGGLVAIVVKLIDLIPNG